MASSSYEQAALLMALVCALVLGKEIHELAIGEEGALDATSVRKSTRAPSSLALYGYHLRD
jgi:hypothetical protein